VIAGAATSWTSTLAGGTPSTVRRWTTREARWSTETTYTVAVDESDCAGVRLVYAPVGPKVAMSGVVELATSSALFTVQSSAPSSLELSTSQPSKTSAATTTTSSSVPMRGWSAQPPAGSDETVHAPPGSAPLETARSTARRSTSETEAKKRPVAAS
jgi:hypothetical protein